METSHHTYLGQARFDSLDGLRALSILGVIWFHTTATTSGGLHANHGWQGVSLFFAISGFLITTLLLREHSSRGQIDLRAFYIRRALRIFPLYFAVLALYALVVWWLERDPVVRSEFWNNLPYFLTYTSNLFVKPNPETGQRVIFYFAWSLATEEQFYLVWPWLLTVTRTWKQSLATICALICVAYWGARTDQAWAPVLSVPLLAGAALALLLHKERSYQLLSWVLRRKGADLVCLALVLLSIGYPGLLFLSTDLWLVLFVASCVISNDHALAKCLTWRPMAYLGVISYGLYMLHMLSKNVAVRVLDLWHLPASGVAVFLLTLFISVLAASLSFRYFEQPFLRLKQRFVR